MKNVNLRSISDEADFLAHAEALVQEAQERYEQLADSMEVHNNREAAAQFRQMETMARHNLRLIGEKAVGLSLPAIAPWNFKWHCPDDPDSDCLSDMDYLINPAGALTAALHNECRIEAFYRNVAEQTPDSGVRNIAAELADYQLRQIARLKHRLGALSLEAYESAEDLDPPNVPD